ncbi:Crp/Fnr family transcriptional regulator [Streptomyces sp. NPDC003077]|uniref:Crp/Fnr family transcriptional regulator n=1 Tax=Streptomyces sp. NPDC003077 TaxID=3154443 RepID=UPI00339F724A
MSNHDHRTEQVPEPADRTLRALAGEDVWAELVRQSHERWHPPGTLLLRQDEPGTHVLAVLSGVAKVVRTERDGKRNLLAFRGPGELLGEVAVLAGGGRLASVETLARCKVGVMSKADFARFIAAHDLSPVLVRYALARLRESDQARRGGDVLPRLAATLVRLADLSSRPGTCPTGPLELALTRDELAQHLRTSRNTVTAKLAELESCRVHARRLRIVINDLPALRRAAATALGG